MRNVIKGVVVDHRVPSYIHHPFNEAGPTKNKVYHLWRVMKYRFMTHPYFTLPVVVISTSIAFYSLAMLYKRYVLGNRDNMFSSNLISSLPKI